MIVSKKYFHEILLKLANITTVKWQIFGKHGVRFRSAI